MINDINKPEQIHLNFNASKIRWLSSSKIAPTNVFCIGSGENLVIFHFQNDPIPDQY